MLGIQDENFTKMNVTIGQLQKPTGEAGAGQPTIRGSHRGDRMPHRRPDDR
jgi:hypothetical protein